MRWDFFRNPWTLYAFLLHQYVSLSLKYISDHLHHTETYANAVYPGNTCSNYFLLFINGSNIFGAIL